MIQEVINGYIIECQRIVRDEENKEETISFVYRVNAATPQAAYKLVQEEITNLENTSIKGVIKEYPAASFVGIIR